MFGVYTIALVQCHLVTVIHLMGYVHVCVTCTVSILSVAVPAVLRRSPVPAHFDCWCWRLSTECCSVLMLIVIGQFHL